MIKNFASKMAEDIYHGVNSRYARSLSVGLHEKARRLLDQIDAATRIETLDELKLINSGQLFFIGKMAMQKMLIS